jgi:transcriptional regulator with PAS, ATPase and Fis domain
MREYFGARVRARGGRQELEEDEFEERERRSAKTMEQVKLDAILSAYEAHDRNAQAACRELKISKASFYRAMKKHQYKVDKTLRRRRG